jgi:hypothetical protein
MHPSFNGCANIPLRSSACWQAKMVVLTFVNVYKGDSEKASVRRQKLTLPVCMASRSVIAVCHSHIFDTSSPSRLHWEWSCRFLWPVFALFSFFFYPGAVGVPSYQRQFCVVADLWFTCFVNSLSGVIGVTQNCHTFDYVVTMVLCCDYDTYVCATITLNCGGRSSNIFAVTFIGVYFLPIALFVMANRGV